LFHAEGRVETDRHDEANSCFRNFANAPKSNQLMLYSEIVAVCSEIHTKHINTVCGQNVEFCNVKPGGTYGDRWVTGPFIMTAWP
jgi:hypothetical protein